MSCALLMVSIQWFLIPGSVCFSKLPPQKKIENLNKILWKIWERMSVGGIGNWIFVSKLRWGWVFFERTRILRGIQFITHFIEIQVFVVGTKRFVCSFANVILTWQICGQRSSRAVESKRRALGNYFSERICYMFLAWISEFWRIIRIIRIYEFLNSDFSKFWKPNFFHILHFSDFQKLKWKTQWRLQIRSSSHASRGQDNAQ